MGDNLLDVRMDLSEVASAYHMSNEEAESMAESIVEGLASRYFANIIDLAKTKLHQTRSEYIRSLRMSKVGRNVAIIELLGVVPNMVEMGSSAFDMKRGFSDSSKTKAKKNGGWYLTVPFTHAWSGALGEASYFTNVMPREVHSVARTLGSGDRMSTPMIPGRFSAPGRREKVSNESREFKEYMHKSSIYAGMVRKRISGHTSYSTFRRVSDKSDPDSWIHTGIEERNLFGLAGDNPNLIHAVDIARDNYIASLGL